MRVRWIGLDNVKCFPVDTVIDFCVNKEDPHKWVVIYGDNGLGKSTLLKAIGVALTGQPALNALLPTAEGWVRGSHRSAEIFVDFQKGPGDTSTGYPRARPISLIWRLVGARAMTLRGEVYPPHAIYLAEQFGNLEEQRGRRTFVKYVVQDAKLFKEQVANDQPRRGWLLCGYGPHSRLSGAASEIAEGIPPDGRAARVVTLFHEKAALTSAERWLRELDHHALLDKTGAAQKRLDAITTMINSGLSHGGVELAEITPEDVFFKTPFSARVSINELSDGYRSVLALALDLLRRVAYCFDIEHVLKAENGRAYVTAEGVVLIDEIDAHLHPSWQRTIGAWLHERFPNMQFIVATHSPLIATRVSETEGMVVRLVRRKKGKAEVVEAITEEGEMGLTADQNLTGPNFQLTSTRDVLTDALFEEAARLRARLRIKQATRAEVKRLKELENKIRQIAPATPTYAGVDGWRKEAGRIQSVSESLEREEGSRR